MCLIVYTVREPSRNSQSYQNMKLLSRWNTTHPVFPYNRDDGPQDRKETQTWARTATGHGDAR